MFELVDPVTQEKISYHIDKKLFFLLDRIKTYISKNDKDYVLLVDGYEGSGKTTFAIQLGKYVDPTLNLNRVCMTPEEFKEAIITAKKGQCVIYDEAVTGLTAGAAITKIGKLLKSLMMQMRQQNLFVIVLLPTIFELNKYAVLSRARFTFHIYESKGRMGYWVGLNRKDTRITYLKGKRTHTYTVRSRYNGRFYGKFALGASQEAPYRKKKGKALKEAGEDEEYDERGSKWRFQRDIALFIANELGMSHEKISKRYKELGYTYSSSAVGDSVKKIRKKQGKVGEQP